MMKKLLIVLIGLACSLDLYGQKAGVFNGLDMNMGNLYRLSDARTRSISPENPTGEPGKGGMATLEEGVHGKQARELGQGWKVNPFIWIEGGQTVTLAEIEGPGVIQHIWMTPTGNWRYSILRFYWDDEKEPSVEVPVGDFFGMGWGVNNRGWWGEGEIKFYMDGDKKFPTINGTGAEDYFCGSYNFENKKTRQYEEYSTAYAGLPSKNVLEVN
jgi:hypothetical protein